MFWCLNDSRFIWMGQIFPKNFSGNFLRIRYMRDWTPLLPVKTSYMGGIRWGGGGHITGGPPCQDQRRGSFVNNFIWKLSDQLFGGINGNHYLCIDNVREMSGWGNNTSWSVDSILFICLVTYKRKKFPTPKKGITEIVMLLNSSWTLRTAWVTEQPIPFCGENEFYYKYIIH